jgi:hypothetical protein
MGEKYYLNGCKKRFKYVTQPIFKGDTKDY